MDIKRVDSESDDEALSDLEEYDEENMKDMDFEDSKFTNFASLVKDVESKVNETTTEKKTMSLNVIKILVSKQKKRFSMDGFDLDLTYITDRIIAMGFPAESYESFYRNSMVDVQRFFERRHPGKYKIYNLCSERAYDADKFHGNVAVFPFDDHNPPKFNLIFEFCVDVKKWLDQDPKNVVAIHCKAGKGRTGLMVCCYLLYSHVFYRAYDAFRYYGMARTKNKKGITIPSQIRYTYYFEEALKRGWTFEMVPEPTLELTNIRFITIPNFNMFGGCEPWFKIECGKMTYSSKDHIPMVSYKSSEAFADMILEEKVVVKGDVKIEFYNNSLFNSKKKMFTFWFHTGFFDATGKLFIEKYMLDGAWRDKSHKKFPQNFAVEVEGIILKSEK